MTIQENEIPQILNQFHKGNTIKPYQKLSNLSVDKKSIKKR